MLIPQHNDTLHGTRSFPILCFSSLKILYFSIRVLCGERAKKKKKGFAWCFSEVCGTTWPLYDHTCVYGMNSLIVLFFLPWLCTLPLYKLFDFEQPRAKRRGFGLALMCLRPQCI
ncbi:hypothetical protein Dimus_025945 [Dionaea muscipula]